VCYALCVVLVFLKYKFMGNFQRGDRSGNRNGGFRNNNGGRGGFGGGRGGGAVTMHKAVCDEGHKTCEVPFRPSNDKPIYCNECFSGKRDDNDRGGKRDFSSRGPKREFGNKSSVNSFGKQSDGLDEVKKQFGEISIKLDKLISAIDKLTGLKEDKRPVVKVEAKKPISKVAVALKKVAPKASLKKVIVKRKK